MLRSLALRPPAVSQSAPHFPSLLFPFSGIPFFLFFFFFFSQFKSEVKKAVLFSIEFSGRLSPSSETVFSRLSFCFIPRIYWVFKGFPHAAGGYAHGFFFRIFSWFFLSFPKREQKNNRKNIFRVADKTGFFLNPRVITATKKDQGQACKNTSPVQGLSIFFRIIFFAPFRVFSGLNGYPHNI